MEQQQIDKVFLPTHFQSILELLQKVRRGDMRPTQSYRALLSDSVEAQTVYGDFDRDLLPGEISSSIG
jgi:hypothetical protein